jgi:hypothetical protein
MKYTLIAEDTYGGSKTTREFEADYLPNVLEELELFLKGAGFIFDGNLDFVNDFEEDYTEQKFDTEEFQFDITQGPTITNEELPPNNWPFAKTDAVEHNEYYFDTERNK